MISLSVVKYVKLSVFSFVVDFFMSNRALPIAVAAILGALALVPVYFATQNPQKFLPLKSASRFDPKSASPIEKISYFFGYKVTTEMTPPEIDIDAFNAGARAGHSHDKMPYSEAELKAALEQYVAEQQKKAPASTLPAASTAPMGDENVKFLQDNAKQAGVQTTSSGLQYKIIREGKGKTPQPTDTVKVNYEGKLVNGQIFDSSYQRGEPIEFKLNQVIPGWTEGLQLIKEGGEIMLFVPPQLGYGAQGMGPIPPNSTLIFRVELLGVK